MGSDRLLQPGGDQGPARAAAVLGLPGDDSSQWPAYWDEYQRPHADLHAAFVVTHGGSNTVTESFWFGRPIVLLPLFWDQHDDAQRVHETGFGIRLDTYGHAPEELTAAVDRLLADAPLRGRLAAVSRRLQSAPGTVRAADAIERVARATAAA